MEDKRKEFMQEFQQLLEKYDCHISSEDHYEGYSECGEDVRMTVEFCDWQIKDIDLGGSIYKDSQKIIN